MVGLLGDRFAFDIFRKSKEFFDDARLFQLKIRITVADAVNIALQIQFAQQLYFPAFLRKRVAAVVTNDVAIVVKLKRIGVDVFFFDKILGNHRRNKFFKTAGYDQHLVRMIFKKYGIARKRCGYLLF